MAWRVQYAYAVEVGVPAVHAREEAARGEVAYLLGNWLMKNLSHAARKFTREGIGQEFAMDAGAVYEQIMGLLGADRVWEAYDVWQEFYRKFENELGYPLWVAIGTVIVDSGGVGGPATKLPFIKPGKKSPAEEYGLRKAPPRGIEDYREAKEFRSIVDAVYEKLIERVEQTGETIGYDDYLQAIKETMEQVQAEVESSGEEWDPERQNLRLEQILKARFNLSGRLRRRA